MRRLGLLLAVAMALVTPAAAQARTCARPDASQPAAVSRVAGDWRGSALSLVPATRPPVPQGSQDLGVAPGGMTLDRMLLLLEPSPAQQTALDALLANQQTAGTCAWHQWLSPAEFADSFANSLADVNAVAAWLQQAGFTVAPIPAGRGWIEFSGTVAQVEAAFNVPVHAYATATGTRAIIAADLSVPVALRPLIHALVSLDGVVATPAITAIQPVTASASALAAETSVSHAEALTPSLAAQFLHLDSVHSAGTQGEGETIAIAARSNVQAQDIALFRSAFGLPAIPVAVTPAGADPGFTADQAAAEFAASWAAATAPAAKIVIAPAGTTQATDGVDLSLAALIDQSAAHTIVVGFSACEASMSETHQAFYADLYREAAAQGISIVGAAGDSGASACHAAGSAEPVTTGYSVNALVATPWNTAVGAAALASSDGYDLAAWAPQSPADAHYAGGGGASRIYSLPSWQPELDPHTLKGISAIEFSGGPVRMYRFGVIDSAARSGFWLPSNTLSSVSRMVPDLSLPTGIDSGYNRGLAFCFSGMTPSSGCTLVRSGGSSAAAALFGGISALLAQKYGAQGNLAPRLYQIHSQAGVFQDVAQGSTSLACAGGSPGCDASGLIGFDAVAGFDLATGLGVPNADKLITAWARPDLISATTTVITVSPPAVNNTYNPSALLTFTVSVSPTNNGSIAGAVVPLTDSLTSGSLGSVTLDSTGNGSLTPALYALPLNSNTITATFPAFGNYTSSSGMVTVTMSPSQTFMTITPSTTTPAAGSVITVTVTITENTPDPGTVPPSSKVTLALDGVAIGTATPITSSTGVTTATFSSVTVPAAAGSHNLQATYPGDPNYKASAATTAITVGKGATVTTLTATPAALTPGTAETLTATVAPINPVTGTTYTITGSISFYDGATLLGTAVLALNSASLSNITLSAGVSHVLTAVYSGDPNWAASTSNPLALTAALLADTVTLTVSPASAAPGQVVTLVATVTPAVAPASTAEQNPTGNVIFYVGTKVLGTVALSPSLNNTSTATLLNATLPAGQDVLTAVYVGDLFYATGTSNSITINIQDFSIAPSGTNPPTNLNIVKGTAGTASFVVTGLGGFNGQISVVCAIPTQDDMTCTPSPQQVVPTGTVSFTVTTFLAGGPSTAGRRDAPFWPRAAGGVALALFLFLLPIGRRARVLHESARRVLMLILSLGAIMGFATGCQSVSGSAASSGTPLGVATLTITGASYVDNTVVSHSVYLTVNVLPPGSTAVQESRGGNQ